MKPRPIDVRLLARSIIEAARAGAGDGWCQTRAFAEIELTRLARSAADIERLVRRGHIDEHRAKNLFEVYRVAAYTALLTAEALSVATAEAIMTAALGVIRKAICRSLGFAIAGKEYAMPKDNKNKTTRDRVAQSAARLLRNSSDPDVTRVAASALAQSDPKPDRVRRRPRRTIRRRPPAQFKAGKDLVTGEPQEGGSTE